jgi:hypothetical protein
MVQGRAAALRGQSRRLAANAGVTPEEALKEWTARFYEDPQK